MEYASHEQILSKVAKPLLYFHTTSWSSLHFLLHKRTFHSCQMHIDCILGNFMNDKVVLSVVTVQFILPITEKPYQ